MFQKIRNKTPAIAAFPFKIAAVAAVLIAPCLLPCANAGLIGPHQLKTSAKPRDFDMPAAAAVQFLAFSQQRNADVRGDYFDMRTVAAVALLSPPLEFKAVLQPAIVAVPTMASIKSPSDTLAPRATFNGAPRSLAVNVARVNFETPSLAPMSFVRFCMQHPQDCKVNGIAFRPRPVELTKARIAELARVNREVNRAIRPKANTNGVLAEEWLISPSEGDCKDYAVTKRHELLALGWPSRSLLLAEVVIASGEHHVVLVARTRENDLVLDNLNWNVRPVSQVGYEWVRAQQAGNPKYWSTIGVVRAMRVAMNSH